MGLRSSERKLSFDILSFDNNKEDDSLSLFRSISDSSHNRTKSDADIPPTPKSRKKKRQKKKKPTSPSFDAIPEDVVLDSDERIGSGIRFESRSDVNCQSSSYGGSVCTVVAASGESGTSLRQRNVNGTDDLAAEESPSEKQERRSETMPNGSSGGGGGVLTKLETAESLDWKRLMAEDPHGTYPIEQSPWKYFMEAMYSGNSLQSTTTIGDEKERQRVYDTIFRLPWRCELIIDVGFFVCLDSFLSLLTIMPTRILMTLYRLLIKRQFNSPSTAVLCDFSCFIVLACGVTLLERTDISLIYHMIRGQGTVKLYVVYNVLEIFDRLCQNFGGDVLETLFYSAETLANCSEENRSSCTWKFFYDLALATASSIFHSFILLAQAITLSTCIVAHNNALLALLVSNNFSEIKGSVFKRFSKENIQILVYADSIERFHISAFLLFVLAQNILEAEGPWFNSFIFNALMVFLCEMLIDVIKHSFLAKFNGIKPIAYSEYLEDLCKQTLNIKTENEKKMLTFVPLAPACVVIRVLTPVFAAHLPCNPLPWRLFWIFLLSAITYVMLTSLKVMIGMGLQKHATWYVERCRKRKHHLHSD
ncbi:protein POLLEN DEFECTIVE IN GUIDANCE 1-like isoform X2 [Mangifera indica]|uniref:protein POLLEN DEFECTIVE IN GUIDANCE 1-like isoform X2 n=1 Tax=Mangifera indica TaxID=29780 RepID=UPI001CFBE6CF|nr:protein POLLEN DEFECTIVE IN GUIDANCE 1-like isoform X2 [Mangifera indica]